LRAIQHKKPDGTVEMFLSESDMADHIKQMQADMTNLETLLDQYTEDTMRLAAAWDRFRKDPKNLALLFDVSGWVQQLSVLAIALRGLDDEHS